MTIPSLLVLDSGVGGLSITGEILTRCPTLHVDYLADLAGFPYGTKSEEHIVDRVTELVRHTTDLLNPSVIVVACNTASTVALTAVRQITKVPVVGVVPAIKPAAQMSKTGIIGVLATEGTVNRTYTHNLIQEFAKSRTVVLHGSALLVELAEQKLRGNVIDLELIRQELKPLTDKAVHMDTVVLACTHFPLLKEDFMACYPQIRYWVDSGAAIAKRVESLLVEQGVEIPSTGSPTNLNNFHFTRPQAHYDQASIARYLGRFTASFLAI